MWRAGWRIALKPRKSVGETAPHRSASKTEDRKPPLQEQPMQRTEKSPSPWTPWLSWGVVAAYLMLGFGFQSCYAILNKQMAERLLLSATDIGAISSTYTWSFAVAQLLSGALLDRLGARRILPKACFLLTAGIFCFAWSPGRAGLIAAQALVAVGSSFGFVSAGFMSRVWFSPRLYGVMFSLAQFLVSFFAFICQQTLARGLEGLPYEWVISGLGAAGVALLSAMLLCLRDPPRLAGADGPPQSLLLLIKHLLLSVLKVIRMPGVARLIVVGAASFGAMLSLSAVWGPRLLMAQGLPEVAAGSAVSFGWLGLGVGSPVLVWYGQKYDREKGMVMLGLALQCFCVSLMLLFKMEEASLYSALMLLWGIGAGANLLPFVLAARCAGEAHTGTAMALVNCGQFIVGGLLTYIPGRLLDLGPGIGIAGALLILPVSLLATLLLCFKLKVERC